MAYDKRLIKRKHNDEFDRQELSQRAFPFKFCTCEAIKHDQTIEGNARWIRFEKVIKRGRQNSFYLPDAHKIYSVKVNRSMMDAITISWTEYLQFVADDAGYWSS